MLYYLMAYLVNVKTPDFSARHDIELKGSHEKVTKREVDAPVKKIHAVINPR